MPEKTAKRKVHLQSSPQALDESRQWLLSKLKEYKYCEDDVFAVHLALEEAFFNAVKHGNKMNYDNEINVDFTVAPDKVEIIMTDSGEGFNPDSIPDCRVGENLYKTDGRGIFLIRCYMDVVEFNEKGNSIHMIRHHRKPTNSAESKSAID
ncbi:MAG: ATP-binding protein [Sedimentisphaerales bacterium]|nr:ATP-binding protein [Sedimentisphaerales bacterium]